MNGRSFGKQIFNLKIVVLTGGRMTPRRSAQRNWPLALPTLFTAIGGGTVYWLFSMIGFLIVVTEIVLTLRNATGPWHFRHSSPPLAAARSTGSSP